MITQQATKSKGMFCFVFCFSSLNLFSLSWSDHELRKPHHRSFTLSLFNHFFEVNALQSHGFSRSTFCHLFRTTLCSLIIWCYSIINSFCLILSSDWQSLIHFQSSCNSRRNHVSWIQFSFALFVSGYEFKEVLLFVGNCDHIAYLFVSHVCKSLSTGTTFTFNLSFRPFSLGPNLRPASHHIPVSAFA